MKPLKNATEKDIRELKQRLKERKDQRILDRDAQEVFNIIRKHKEGKVNAK